MDVQTILNILLTLGFVISVRKVHKLERDLYITVVSLKKDLEQILSEQDEIGK